MQTSSRLAKSKTSKFTPEQYRAWCREDPERYVRQMLNFKPYDKQVEVLEAVRDNMCVAVKGAVAVGKTMDIAAIVLWFLNSYAPAKAVTFAPTFRQVEKNIWGDIHTLYDDAKFPVGGKLNLTELKLAKNIYASGISTKDPNYVQGIHSENVLIVIDEAPGIAPELWPAIENAMMGGNVRFLVLMNPTPVSGPAYDIFHKHKKFWKLITMSAWDSPNVKAKKIIIPGLVTYPAVQRVIKKFGKNSNYVRIKVHAKFPTQEPDSLVPLDWIHRAYEREPVYGDNGVATDVARYGDDNSVLMPWSGRHIFSSSPDTVVLSGHNTMEVSGRNKLMCQTRKAKTSMIDSIGIGAGVVDRCLETFEEGRIAKEMDCSVIGVNVGKGSKENVKTKEGLRFINLRAELWWRVREAFDPEGSEPISLAHDEELEEELCAMKWRVSESEGKIRVSPKTEPTTNDRPVGKSQMPSLKRVLGRSPDKGDALMLAVAGMTYSDLTELMEPGQPQPGLELDIRKNEIVDKLEGAVEEMIGGGTVADAIGGLEPL
ncbi:MAG: hypothetical protein V3T23_01385 [Nitrososphaerales archaeon]